MKRTILLLAFLFTCSIGLRAQDSTVKTGRLDNGFSYYIYETKDFGREVNCYLLQNVGAIVEADDEQGMAHFLEHIAFNTTKHYPSGVMSFLTSNGIQFNALTGVSETKYYLYSIPSDDPSKLDEALQLIQDWCGGIDINRKSVEKEKGIVTEEWRQRQGLQKRIQDEIAPVIYNYSPYAYRNVIGTPEGIQSITPKKLQAFYDRWYRPDLQCIVLIGDYPAEELEQIVKERFSGLSVPRGAPKRTDPLIENHDEVLYKAFEDAENTNYSFGIYQRVFTPSDPSRRNSIQDNLFSMIFNKLIAQRIGMILNDGSEEFIAAVSTYAPLVRQYAQNAWDVVPYSGREREALHQALAIREAVRREGFTEHEFEGAQEAIYKDLQELLSSEKLGTPDNIMEVFRQNYLYGQPLTSFRQQLTGTVETLIELSVEDLNNWVKSWMTDQNLSFVTYTGSDAPSLLGLSDFTTLLSEVKEEPTLRFVTPEKIDQLIPDGSLTPGKVVREKELPELQAKEWYLSNGARMLYMPLPDLKGEVFFAGTAMGGHSIIDPKDIPSYDMMQSLLLHSGVGGYSRNSLAQWLAGKSFDLNLNITEYTDGIGGTTTTQSLPDMMAYTHLIIGRHLFTEEAFQKQMERQTYLRSNRSKTGLEAVNDSIRWLLYPASPLNPVKNEQYYRAISLKRVRELFDEKFGNLGHFTFCIAGDIPEDEARRLTELYIASLPGEQGTEPRQYRDRDLSSQEREIRAEFTGDIPGDIGQVEQSYISTAELSAREQKTLKIIEGLLRSFLFDELREKENLTYGIAAQAGYQAFPNPSTTINIHIETSREKVDLVDRKVDEILHRLGDGSLDEADFKRAMLPLAMEEKMTAGTDEDSESTDHPLLKIALLNVYMETGELPTAEKKEEAEVHFDEIKAEEVPQLLKKIMTTAKKRHIIVRSTPPDFEHIHH